MTPKERLTLFFETVRTDLDLLQNEFFVIGSGALVLSGVAVDSMEDIDMLTSSPDAGFLKERWASHIQPTYVPDCPSLFRSDFARFRFDGISVEVMGNLQVNKGQCWVPLLVQEYQAVEIAGCSVKVPTLMEQFRIFRFFGRPKDLQKAELLKNYL